MNRETFAAIDAFVANFRANVRAGNPAAADLLDAWLRDRTVLRVEMDWAATGPLAARLALAVPLRCEKFPVTRTLEALSSPHLQTAENEAMTDEQIEDLLQRAADGDNEAQASVDAWIAEALGPVCTTAPMEPIERAGEVIGYDQLECCCGGA